MATLFVLQGISGSGKTTKALQLVSDGCILISRDALRSILLQEVSEELLSVLMFQMADPLLQNGLSVVVDSWNLEEADLVNWLQVGSNSEATVVFVKMDTSVDECVARDAQRVPCVGEQRIREMAEHYGLL